MQRLIPNTKKTKLSPSELKRVASLSGNGESKKYSDSGQTNIRLIKALAKAKQKSGRYVLYSDQLGKRLYIASSVDQAPLTFNLSEALEFYEGFDDPKIKAENWSYLISKTSSYPFVFKTYRTKRAKNGTIKRQEK